MEAAASSRATPDRPTSKETVEFPSHTEYYLTCYTYTYCIKLYNNNINEPTSQPDRHSLDVRRLLEFWAWAETGGQTTDTRQKCRKEWTEMNNRQTYRALLDGKTDRNSENCECQATSHMASRVMSSRAESRVIGAFCERTYKRTL